MGGGILEYVLDCAGRNFECAAAQVLRSRMRISTTDGNWLQARGRNYLG